MEIIIEKSPNGANFLYNNLFGRVILSVATKRFVSSIAGWYLKIKGSMFINNINKFVMEGKILVLNDHLSFRSNKDKELLINIASKMVGDIDEE